MTTQFPPPERASQGRVSVLSTRGRDDSRSIALACDLSARRVARAAAGLVLLLGGLALGVAGFQSGEGVSDEIPALILISSWLTALASYALFRKAAVHWYLARVGESLPVHLSGDVELDAERIQLALSPAPGALTRCHQLELPSVALPLMGLGLLGPLSIHYLCHGLFRASGAQQEFSAWVRTCVVMTGHAHLALSITGALFAFKLQKLETGVIEGATAKDGWLAWAVVTWACALPGAFILLAPSISVSMACALLVPTSFAALRACVIDERATLASAARPADRESRPVERPSLAGDRESRTSMERPSLAGDRESRPWNRSSLPPVLAGPCRAAGPMLMDSRPRRSSSVPIPHVLPRTVRHTEAASPQRALAQAPRGAARRSVLPKPSMDGG